MNKEIENKKNEILGLEHDISDQNRRIWQLFTTIGISIFVSALMGFTFGIVLDKMLKSMMAFMALGGFAAVVEGIKISEAKKEIVLDKAQIKGLRKQIKEIESSASMSVNKTEMATKESEKKEVSNKQIDNMIDTFNNLKQNSGNMRK